MRCLLTTLCLVTLLSCRTPVPDPPLLIEPGAVPGDFLIRQQIEGVFDGRKGSFEAAIQKRGDTLKVVGLTPFGTKAFVMIQTGKQVTFTDHLPPDKKLPVHPRFLLQDIHHAFLLACQVPVGDGGLRDGEYTAQIGEEEEMRERVASGRTQQRSFRSLREFPEGEVVVSYEGGYPLEGAPRITRIQNGYYDYSLTILTLVYQPLD